MNLRTYLVKRTIHMIITMLIVLVLLFVVYRLMPGSAAATLMMSPGMTPEQVDMMMVRYGFGKWSEYPGEYTTRQITLDQIGTYSVTINAIGESGTSDSFSTNIDVNTPLSIDLVPPNILDIGFESPPTLGTPAQIYAILSDENAIRSFEATLVFPNSTIIGGTPVPYTSDLVFREDPARSDETNKTYYWNVTTGENLVSGPIDSDYQLSFEAQDYARNAVSAGLSFDATTGLVTGMVWGLLPDISYSTPSYSYPSTTDNININAYAWGGATNPTYSITAPDGTILATGTLTNPDINNRYVWTSQMSDNGLMTLEVQLDGLSAITSFPVNSRETSYVIPTDSGYPLLTDLAFTYTDGSSGYPFLLRGGGLNLLVNSTILDDNQASCPTNTIVIVFPDGEILGEPPDTKTLSHPIYVEMRSMAEQFVIYMQTMLVFDFGDSFTYNEPVWDIIVDRMPTTALLFGTSLILAYLIGILVGVMVAWRRGTVMELSTIVVTLFFYSMPIFWFALIMQWVFYAELGWFPIAGVGGADAMGNPLHGIDWFVDILWHLALPLITLTVLSLAGTILLMRSSMLEVIGEDFITTAKAKGLKERRVVYHHAARNAMLPVVTAMAMSIGHVISGGILTETIFSWYGMGTLLVEATLQHDFPVVQGAFYILALITVLANMGADILYAYLDPRVQL
jgi:peptide/nickel transport system permease protein